MSKVPSLIDFDAEESPKWRKEGANVLTVKVMIEGIVNYQNMWTEKKKTIDQETLDKLHHESLIEFIYYVNTEEKHGCSTREEITSSLEASETFERPTDIKEIETVNLRDAYKFLLNEIDSLKKVENSEEVEKMHGLLETSLIKNAHKLIMKDIAQKSGEYSKSPRRTEFEGEIYWYAKPEEIKERVETLVNNHNDLMEYHVKEEKDPNVRVYSMFKICGWMLFELLDVHPFSDGNGRLCRLLCSYVLSSMTPFPTPIYNVWTDSKRDDYIRALVETRKSETRHPTSLTTMIIECNYYGWKKFFNILDKSIDPSQSKNVEQRKLYEN